MRLGMTACLVFVSWLGHAPVRAQTPAPVFSDDYLAGRFEPARNSSFVNVRGLFMHRLAYAAYQKMKAAALRAGIKLRVISATRNFDRQKVIWDKKWLANSAIADETQRALAILQYSSMPGTSRHHWGTDFDLGHGGCADAACIEDPAWHGREYEWMLNNAHLYGFCQPFRGAASNRSGFAYGYREERWHWSYEPLSSQALATYQARIDQLAPKPGSFSGATAAATLYKDFVRNVDCSIARKAMIRTATGATTP